MASELSIINAALAALGEEKQLDDLRGDRPPREERVALALLPQLRDAILRLHPWLCGEARITVAREPGEGHADWMFPNAYALPLETLRVWSVETCDPWQKGTLVTRRSDGTVLERRPGLFAVSPGPLKVRVIERVAYEHLDPLLADALSEDLAARMAGPLQADKALAKSLRESARDKLALAVTAETSEFAEGPTLATGRFLAAR